VSELSIDEQIRQLQLSKKKLENDRLLAIKKERTQQAQSMVGKCYRRREGVYHGIGVWFYRFKAFSLLTNLDHIGSLRGDVVYATIVPLDFRPPNEKEIRPSVGYSAIGQSFGLDEKDLKNLLRQIPSNSTLYKPYNIYGYDFDLDGKIPWSDLIEISAEEFEYHEKFAYELHQKIHDHYGGLMQNWNDPKYSSAPPPPPRLESSETTPRIRRVRDPITS
jgi:hypothetical protein